MFQLHERTRRRLAVAAFFVLCVLPTLAVLACGIARRLPGYVGREAARLSTHLGVCVGLDGLDYPRPGVVVYEGLALADPETGETLLSCRQLQAVWEKSAGGKEGRPRSVLRLIALDPEIEAAGLKQLWGPLERVLTNRSGWSEVDIEAVYLEAAAGRVTLLGEETSQALTEVEATLRILATGSQADFRFRLGGGVTAEPARIRVFRTRETERPVTGFAVHTGESALPCSLLALGGPGLEALGPESRFCGYVWANAMPEGWSGEMVGRFEGIDLEELARGRLSEQLRGKADVTVRRAQFAGGRLRQVEAVLSAGPGLIGWGLLEESERWLETVWREESELDSDPVAFEQLQASVVIDSAGVQLRGLCPGVHPGVILADRSGPLLFEPARQPQPIGGLLRTLAPQGHQQVPATRQTEWLLRRLPLP